LFRAAARSWTVCPSSVPLAEIAHLFPGRFAPLRFLTRAPNATSPTLSPPVSLNHRAPSVIRCAPAEFPRRLWTPFPPAEADLPVALGLRDRDRPFRGLSPLRSLDPSPSPFAQRRVTPTLRSLLELLSPSETHRLHLGTSNPPHEPPEGNYSDPEGSPRHALPTRRPERAARGTSSPSTGRDRTQKTTCDRLGEHQRV